MRRDNMHVASASARSWQCGPEYIKLHAAAAAAAVLVSDKTVISLTGPAVHAF